MENLIEVKDIKIKKSLTVNELIKMMGESGGFTAQKLADSVDVAEQMIKKVGCLKILSFPACIMATGTRGVIIDMVKKGYVDLLSPLAVH